MNIYKESELVQAILNNDITLVNSLLDSDVNVQTVRDDTALFLLVNMLEEENIIPIIKKILPKITDINLINYDGDTVLHMLLRLYNKSDKSVKYDIQNVTQDFSKKVEPLPMIQKPHDQLALDIEIQKILTASAAEIFFSGRKICSDEIDLEISEKELIEKVDNLKKEQSKIIIPTNNTIKNIKDFLNSDLEKEESCLLNNDHIKGYHFCDTESMAQHIDGTSYDTSYMANIIGNSNDCMVKIDDMSWDKIKEKVVIKQVAKPFKEQVLDLIKYIIVSYPVTFDIYNKDNISIYELLCESTINMFMIFAEHPSFEPNKILLQVTKSINYKNKDICAMFSYLMNKDINVNTSVEYAAKTNNIFALKKLLQHDVIIDKEILLDLTTSIACKGLINSHFDKVSKPFYYIF